MWEGTARKHKSWGDTLEIEHWSPQLPSPMTRVIVNTLTLLRSCPTDSADNYLITVSTQSPGLIIKIRSRCRSSLSLTHPPLAETGSCIDIPVSKRGDMRAQRNHWPVAVLKLHWAMLADRGWGLSPHLPSKAPELLVLSWVTFPLMTGNTRYLTWGFLSLFCF